MTFLKGEGGQKREAGWRRGPEKAKGEKAKGSKRRRRSGYASSFRLIAGSGKSGPPPSLRPFGHRTQRPKQTPRPPHARPRPLARALRRSAGPHAKIPRFSREKPHQCCAMSRPGKPICATSPERSKGSPPAASTGRRYAGAGSPRLKEHRCLLHYPLSTIHYPLSTIHYPLPHPFVAPSLCRSIAIAKRTSHWAISPAARPSTPFAIMVASAFLQNEPKLARWRNSEPTPNTASCLRGEYLLGVLRASAVHPRHQTRGVMTGARSVRSAASGMPLGSGSLLH